MGSLVTLEAVDAVAWTQGPGAVRVRNRKGVVEFAQPDPATDEISYRVVSGVDPLGYDKALGGKKPISSRDWLAATMATEYPDLPAQIVAYFDASRAGDIAMFAAPGWDFYTKNRAGHGGLRGAEDLFVPLLLAGPGVPKGATAPVAVRTVDLMPTILTLLGKPIPAGLDGQSLLPRPRKK